MKTRSKKTIKESEKPSDKMQKELEELEKLEHFDFGLDEKGA